ncbi:hypothetical protein CYLTODRAFT_494640 [Cylindrobasidium torrendii FP15055 ss-10]|uniref:BTB domain-containing protein n=1 Tax=Cylindrobasidium torrendii FP15055 ss-10 TaxID=1314674 RepID=A0A0D7AVN1_9AGAR|nr:hypothetical protein CYLTODRAFT_494640 [Cylindrobasidium torrendii FP15055 ss-10]
MDSSIDATAVAAHYEPDEKYWFSDGNIILISAKPSRGFCVHRGVLAKHAQFFKDLHEVARAEEEKPELPLTDSADEIKHFLGYIYEIRYFVPCSKAVAFKDLLEAMLHMGRKYLCQSLKDDISQHLRKIYDSSRKRPKEALTPQAKSLIPDENANDHFVYAIRMAQDTPSILPVAFYCAIQDDMAACLKRQTLLHPDDGARLISGRERFSEEVSRVLRAPSQPADRRTYACLVPRPIGIHTLEGDLQYLADRMAPRAQRCNKECLSGRLNALDALGNVQGRDIFMSERVPAREIHHLVQTKSGPVPDDKLCSSCYDEWCATEKANLNALWEKLPSLFGLDPWEEPKVQAQAEVRRFIIGMR